MEGSIWYRRPVRQSTRSRRKPQFRNGGRVAVTRAVAAASISLGIQLKMNQARATAFVGASAHYVKAARLVVQSGDKALLTDVLTGRRSLLKAATEVRGRVDLINAYRRATPDDKAAFGSAVGVDHIFDEAINPSL
jgi:hypothetical protein